VRFFRIPISNIQRRPLRSALTAFGVATAVASCIVFTGLSRGTERAWVSSIAERGIHLMGMGRWELDIMSATVDESLDTAIRSEAGVHRVSGELVNIMRLGEGGNVVLRGWGEGSFLWGTLRLAEGRLPAPGERRTVVVPRGIAEALGVGVGEAITLQGREFEVVGISAPATLVNNFTVVMPLRALQELLGREGKVTEFSLQLDAPGDRRRVAALRAELDRRFPDLSFVETQDIAEDNQVLKTFRAMAWVTSGIALAMAVVIVLNTLVMSVGERTREIGILAAVGWDPARVLAMIVIEGLVLALAGSLLGAALGAASLNWVVRLPRLRGVVEPDVTLRMLVEVCGVALGVGIVASLYPALRAVRMNPVDALKHE
jgi:putative ABC transport system permease protein